MALQVRADQLEKGCRCEVASPGSAAPVLAVITEVRDLGSEIEVDVRTRVALRLPGQIWAANYHTITASRADRVKVSHLPSQSSTDTHRAHGAEQSPEGKAR